MTYVRTYPITHLGLRQQMNNYLYGQHIAKDIVLRSVHAHMEKKYFPSIYGWICSIFSDPKKALVLSFHGWTGSGKNYLASMVRKAMYKNDDQSSYAHLFVSTLHFPHPNEVSLYQVYLCAFHVQFTSEANSILDSRQHKQLWEISVYLRWSWQVAHSSNGCRSTFCWFLWEG